MPDFLTHLAIAKRYAEKNNIVGEEARDFYDGNISVDLMKNKNDAHYRKPAPEKLTIENLNKDRIDFNKFFTENKIETFFEKGILLHLIVDNYCYPIVLDSQRFLQEIEKGVRARAVIIKTFNSVANYLRTRYEIDFDMTSKKKEIEEKLIIWDKQHIGTEFDTELNLLDTPEAIKKLDDFIELSSNINIEAFISNKGQAEINLTKS